MNYNNLTTMEKTTITKLLTAKKALEKAKADYDKAVEKSMAIAKACGHIDKGYAKISYTPESEYITLDTTRLKADKPELLDTYGKQVKRGESLRVVL